ncbi:MAG: hypothetical protein M3Q73_01430 [bacterium]|nr:hypothetical protein [bacterium]
MKKHIPLLIGMALPFIFIIIIAVVVYLPSTFVNPEYDFLYSTNERYYYDRLYKNYYDIENGKIVVRSYNLSSSTINSYQPRQVEDLPPLYRYDIETDASREITFEEVQKLNLDPGPTSPDGYTIAYRYNHDGIFELFGSSNSNRGFYISRGKGKKNLPSITMNGNYYSESSLKLVGWVK